MLALAVSLLLLALLDGLFPPSIPAPDAGQAAVVLDRHGEPLRAFPDHDGVWRYPVDLQQVAPVYLDTLIHYEDQRFHQHLGIDPLALLRAVGLWIRHGRPVSGGSTLSMQVARILEPHDRTILGKVRQMLRALQLERRLSKQQILKLYLDRAPFGGTIEGVQAASFAYLGKPASRLSDAEAALLTVLPQAPSRLRPDRWPERARQARDKVIERMQTLGVWTAERAAAARQEPVVARQLDPPSLAPLLAQRLRGQAPLEPVIQSTIDGELQRRLEAQVAAWSRRLPPASSAAALLVSLERQEVLAYVGTAAFADRERAGFIDMVQAKRSPGSTLKPFLYGMALDQGVIHSRSLLIDAPQDFDGYRPLNFDQRFRGPVDASAALQQSLNVPAVALLQALGPARFAAQLQGAGLRLRMPRGSAPHLAMILGATEVSLADLVMAYGSLGSDGHTRALRYRLDSPASLPNPLISDGASWIVADALASTPDMEEARSYFNRAHLPDFAVKTGTSYGFRDAWAVGSSSGVALGVWVGRPDGTPMPGHYGAISALPLLRQIFEGLPAELRRPARPRPATVAAAEFCWPLGRLRQDTEAEHCRMRLQGWSLNRQVPPTLAPAGESQPPQVVRIQIDAHSRRRINASCTAVHDVETISYASWPLLALPWLSRADREANIAPALADDCAQPDAGGNLQIIGLREGDLVEAARGTATLELAVHALGASGRVRWLLNGQWAGESDPGQALQIGLTDSGPALLVAIDSENRHAQVDFEVSLNTN
ncbi:penicillin-binding protein 1C [Pseudomarimonas arenosa]|uniref:peptidoglycan glycosyltransferase n=1 Tax=Pseudomarimonas arenosa TaxID=2774145 RepID=A0AAW3ZIJ2_9GAMM|nr:penicillin-binding protein 1C [Pseudomarimonas arenosa]MBD8525349.1 penicillin-binding protein 1C [Pseudomarimonas arenosa]